MSLENLNYSDTKDKKLYDYLFYQNKNGEELTEQEKEFVTKMYHMEEVICGLDGERE